MTGSESRVPNNCLVAICFASVLILPTRAEDAQSAKPLLTFEQHIRPIFKAYCLDCHGAEAEKKGGLDLRLKRLMIAGGDSGAALKPGDPENSLLYQRIRDGEMPPRDKKLTEKDRRTILDWIVAGAPVLRDEPAEIGDGIGITPEDQAFWSFQPIRRPAVSEMHFDQSVRTPIDALLLAAMQPVGLVFSPEADKLTLMRRAFLDLTGLPPTPAEVADHLADDSEQAYEKLIDRLLASNRYGERWGRHWLDVAGYADSEGGSTADVVRNFAYKYRDYVIRSLNADKPFDDFITEQLAGDELVKPPYQDLGPDEIEKLVATGFLRMAPDGTGSGATDQEAARNQVIADTIKIVSSALLGLTVGCAQCHDHRHDPVLQSDYYRMRAVFEPALDWKDWRVPAQRQISLYREADRAQAAEIEKEASVVAEERARKQAESIAAALEKELEKFEPSVRETYRTAYFTPINMRTEAQQKIFAENPVLLINSGNLYQYNQAAADELKKYDDKIQAIRNKKPFEDFLRVLTEIPGKVPTTYLFHRGDPKQPKDPIVPGGLAILAPNAQPILIPEKAPALSTTGRRLAYAAWLVSADNPLVARVLVNRVWLHHFGRGLVDTPADFGAMGAPPSNPQLLDWLASEFIEQGWSLKWLHRMILRSTVYRQSSARDAASHARDPANRFLWRKPIQRLEAEILRDRILAVSGSLNRDMFGPPVPIVEDDVGQIVVSPGNDGFRRSIYIQVRRSTPVSMLQQFDMPIMEVNCDKRSTSTVSTQSLALMNSDFVLKQAEEFADRVVRDAGNDAQLQVNYAWQLAFSRSPTNLEAERSLVFLRQQMEFVRSRQLSSVTQADNAAKESDAKKEGASEKQPKQLEPAVQALTNLCQALIGSHEFLFVD